MKHLCGASAWRRSRGASLWQVERCLLVTLGRRRRTCATSSHARVRLRPTGWPSSFGAERCAAGRRGGERETQHGRHSGSRRAGPAPRVLLRFGEAADPAGAAVRTLVDEYGEGDDKVEDGVPPVEVQEHLQRQVRTHLVAVRHHRALRRAVLLLRRNQSRRFEKGFYCCETQTLSTHTAAVMQGAVPRFI